MRRYAEGTEVSPERSRAEIEGLLARYGAEAFGYASDPQRAVVTFKAKGRVVRFVLPMPAAKDFARDRRGAARTPSQVAVALDRERRRLWRSLAMAVKAKLEIVASGITTFEDEFLPHFVLDDGQTVREAIRPALDARAGQNVPLLSGPR